MRPTVTILHLKEAVFNPPKDRDDISFLNDWSEGGINLSDGTQGLQVQFWNFTVGGVGAATGLYLESATYPKTLQLLAENITWVRGTFDQNMHPAISYVSNGVPFLWWWDPTVPAQVITALDVDAKYPTVIMDDTRDRETQLGTNDIVLAYLKGNPPWLYYRLQRDRYEVEHTWYVEGFPDWIEKPYLNRMGMNREWRLQLRFDDLAALEQSV